MTIEVISFLIGALLIATAVVGGGFEIREIKMPRVGAGVRIVSLVVGSGFLLLGLGIWGVNNPQLQAGQTPVNALMQAGAQTGAQAPSPAGAQTQAAAPVDVKQEATAPAQEAAAWAPPPAQAQPGFTGFTGDTYLSWEMQGVAVRAAARFNGASGVIRIGWVDPSTGMQDEVLQDLVLQQDARGVIYYQGANPRDPSTEQLRQDYAPDQFRVVAAAQGWTIDQICDVQACWPVSVP